MTLTVPRPVLIALAVLAVLGAGIGIGVILSGGSDDDGDDAAAGDPGSASGTSDSAYVPPEPEPEATASDAEEEGSPSCDEVLAKNQTGICEGGKPGAEFEVAYLDQTVKLDTLDAKVESVTTAETVGPRYIRANADGIFLIVTLAITNKMSRPQSFSSFQDQTGLNVNDNLYNEDFDAENTSDPKSFLSQAEDIGPGITQVGNVIYDVPPEIADNVLSPRTDAGVIVSEFTRPRSRPVGALILRDQEPAKG